MNCGKEAKVALHCYLFVGICARVHVCACAGEWGGVQWACTGVFRPELNLGCHSSGAVHLGS